MVFIQRNLCKLSAGSNIFWELGCQGKYNQVYLYQVTGAHGGGQGTSQSEDNETGEKISLELHIV